MPAPCSFDYAIVRVVPHVEREEFINAGVVLFCDAKSYLGARIALDEARLLAIAGDADLELVRRHLAAIPVVCGGGAGAGAIGQLPMRERWRWLVAPRSTILQMSPPHVGLGDDPDAAIERLLDRVVRARVTPSRRASSSGPRR